MFDNSKKVIIKTKGVIAMSSEKKSNKNEKNNSKENKQNNKDN